MKSGKITFIAGDDYWGLRLDAVLVIRYPDRSRQYFQKLLRTGMVKVNGKAAKASSKLKNGDTVAVRFPSPIALDLKPLEMDLNVVFENDDLLVLDKPPGLVVHPGEGVTHRDDSLVNALLHHCKGSLSEINGVLRPGIVHRLDKNTSGLLVVAKNDTTHRYLVEQFQERKVEKVYMALLLGHLEPMKGSIEAPIGRDRQNRKKMAVVNERQGKMGLTHYEVVSYLGDYSLVKVKIITGRTHQIRVHFSSIGFPVAGDDLYGTSKINKELRDLYGLERQFLHARDLTFTFLGETKKRLFTSPLPADLQSVIDGLTP